MRNGLLAALTVLLIGHGWAFAQSDVSCQAHTCGFWGSGEYLFWWLKDGQVPPLVTQGGNGVVGAPGTQVLVNNLDFVDADRHGGRVALGYHFAKMPCFGVEASYFYLPDEHSDARFSSSGDPVLGRPYINAVTGLPTATLIAAPGQASGSITLASETGLWGVEANLTADLLRSCPFYLSALGGFRFLNLDDELTLDEQFLFGGNAVRLVDEFRTVNRFYGGQVGLETGVQFEWLKIDFRGKIGLGRMHQVAQVSGATNVLAPDGSTTFFPGGLLALQSNIGRHQQDALAFLPEVGLNVGVQVTPHLKFYAGYSFLWVSAVARAGEQIDPVVNESQFPILSGNGPLVGPARPAFHFDETDFWAQGLNLGLELRY